MNTKKKSIVLILFTFILAIFLLILLTGYGKQTNQYPRKLSMGNKTLTLEIADSDSEKIKGLSNRKSFEKNSGLLFIYDYPGKHGIWMKEMSFSIDIIWLDKNFKVLDIEKNVSPNTYPKVFLPTTSANYVLEVNAGVSKENNINHGDKLSPKY